MSIPLPRPEGGAAWRGAGEKRPVSGVFVGGQRPLWLVADRGRLLPHPATVDGAATAFTPFHNDLCQSVRPPARNQDKAGPQEAAHSVTAL